MIAEQFDNAGTLQYSRWDVMPAVLKDLDQPTSFAEADDGRLFALWVDTGDTVIVLHREWARVPSIVEIHDEWVRIHAETK